MLEVLFSVQDLYFIHNCMYDKDISFSFVIDQLQILSSYCVYSMKYFEIGHIAYVIALAKYFKIIMLKNLIKI